MSQEQLDARVEDLRVFARVSPEHKVMIVKALKSRGHSRLDDGRRSTTRLPQGRGHRRGDGDHGTDVAKGAADMVLTDDNFATIVKAVENGRNVYQNIKKSIQFLLSGNFGAILTVLCASVAGLPVPFAAVHLLFINLLTDSSPPSPWAWSPTPPR